MEPKREILEVSYPNGSGPEEEGEHEADGFPGGKGSNFLEVQDCYDQRTV